MDAPDCVFVLGETTINAHSRILSQSRPFQQALTKLTQPPTPSTPLSIPIPPFISPLTLQTFLTFLYHQTYSPPTDQDPPAIQHPPPPNTPLHKVYTPHTATPHLPTLIELYKLASDYAIDSLKVKVASDLLRRLSKENLGLVMAKAGEVGAEAVLEMGRQFARRNGMELGQEGGGGVERRLVAPVGRRRGDSPLQVPLTLEEGRRGGSGEVGEGSREAQGDVRKIHVPKKMRVGNEKAQRM
ncbi:hypothetical protein HDV05_006975 [Chytridiales sp. JEL 0842]|nr:hypothetical protein HDV05_006975 [Chytridiales sp. JEL 0842]